MKLFVYEYNKRVLKEIFDECSEKYKIPYEYSSFVPTMENVKGLKGFDAINIGVTKVDKQLLNEMNKVGIKYITSHSVGLEHIDLDCAKKLGIKVFPSPYSPNSVANYTIMLMMMCCRKINIILEDMKKENYYIDNKIGVDISSCTIGVIGTGNIGKTVLKHLSGFGCNLLAYGHNTDSDISNIATCVSLDELLKKSDIISLHVPSRPENRHLIDSKTISKMKTGVIIINTARGDLINTKDLINALKTKKVSCVALDVLEYEQKIFVDKNGQLKFKDDLAYKKYKELADELLNLNEAIVLPHKAYLTKQAEKQMIESAFKQLSKYK